MNKKTASRRRKTLKLRRDSIRLLSPANMRRIAGGTEETGGGGEPDGDGTKTTTIWSAYSACMP